MILKNCDLRKMSTHIGLAISLTERIYAHYNREMVITSVCDGTHGVGSLHASGNAFDVRIKNLDGDDTNITDNDQHLAAQIVEDLRHELGAQFDVVLEKDHIHVEYDPKG